MRRETRRPSVVKIIFGATHTHTHTTPSNFSDSRFVVVVIDPSSSNNSDSTLTPTERLTARSLCRTDCVFASHATRRYATLRRYPQVQLAACIGANDGIPGGVEHVQALHRAHSFGSQAHDARAIRVEDLRAT